MKMFIHSCYGVLECESMTLQAIENSIPETLSTINEDENETESVNEDSKETE